MHVQMTSRKSKVIPREGATPKCPRPPPASPRDLAFEIEAVKASQINLVKGFEQNTNVFSDAFQMTDAQIHVMQRVLNDFLLGRVYMKDGNIDFAEYMVEYWAVQSFAQFIARLKFMSEEESAFLAANLTVPSDVVIFGGT